MKIGLVTDDGETISRHFGRARYYLVVTIENGQEQGREMREKFGHHQVMAEGGQAGEHQHAPASSERHGTDPAAQNRHRMMADAIADCQVLVAGGMGSGAFDSMKAAGIQPIVTNLTRIDEAIGAYVNNQLNHEDQLVH